MLALWRVHAGNVVDGVCKRIASVLVGQENGRQAHFFNEFAYNALLCALTASDTSSEERRASNEQRSAKVAALPWAVADDTSASARDEWTLVIDNDLSEMFTLRTRTWL